MTNKIQYFNYVVYELVEWYKEYFWKDSLLDNDLWRLKVSKLLFLLVMKNKNLVHIFNNFEAYDLWPCEVDILNAIKWNNKELKYEIWKQKIEQFWIVENIYSREAEYIKKCVENLKEENKELIWYTSSVLADISCNYMCYEIVRYFYHSKNDDERYLKITKWTIFNESRQIFKKCRRKYF